MQKFKFGFASTSSHPAKKSKDDDEFNLGVFEPYADLSSKEDGFVFPRI